MAFYDWNHNGKKDWQDDFLEYHIYQESMKNNINNYSGNRNYSGNSSGSGCLACFVICAILFFIGLF